MERRMGLGVWGSWSWAACCGMARCSFGKPDRETSRRDGFGAALNQLQGCPGSVLGARCSCPGSSTSKMLCRLGPCRLLGEETQPSPRKGIPSTKASHQSPFKGRVSRQSVLM